MKLIHIPKHFSRHELRGCLSHQAVVKRLMFHPFPQVLLKTQHGTHPLFQAILKISQSGHKLWSRLQCKSKGSRTRAAQRGQRFKLVKQQIKEAPSEQSDREEGRKMTTNVQDRNDIQ